MPSTLAESLDLVKQLRAENGATVAHLNDQELADVVYQQTKDERLRPAGSSNAFQRGTHKAGKFFSELGQSTESAIADESSPFLQKLAGRTAGNLVSGIPELASGVAAASMRGVPRALTALAGSTFVYGRNKAETNDTKAAGGAAAGYLASLAGGIKGAQVGERLLAPGASEVAKFATSTVTSGLGAIPGDALSMVSQPGGFENVKKFVDDPLDWGSYLLGEVGVGGAMHLAQKAATSRKVAAEKVKADTPDMSTLVEKTDADRFVDLNKIPVSELTELQAEEKRQLARSLGKQDEKILADKLAKKNVTPADLSGMPEVPATIKSQLYLLNTQKKAVVELPKGQEAPDMLEVMQGFKTHESEVNGNTYFYDERKTTPEQIDNSIKTNSLGFLLGYGTPSIPADPSGEVAVLRSKRGVEKAAVVLDTASKPTVLDALGKMALADDRVAVESPEQVLSWRKQNQGLTKLFSIARSEEGPLNPQNEISFTNHVLDMFESSTKTKQSGSKFKGPKFQLDQEGKLGTKGLLRAIQDWAPAELWEHYKSQGIETAFEPGNRLVSDLTPQEIASGKQTLLGINKVGAADFTKWLRENTPEVEVKKLVPFQLDKSDARTAQAQHRLETQGFRIDENGNVRHPGAYGDEVIDKVDSQVIQSYGNSTASDIDLIINRHPARRMADSDAATGRYGVEPKELKDMPGAVDILVRVPEKGRAVREMDGVSADEARTYNKNILYVGPHFSNSDVNVLASIRGYMETLPSGEKVFHVFELQSDWGQNRSKFEQRMKAKGLSEENYRATAEQRAIERGMDTDDIAFMREGLVVNHPLLASYETLALKTAIQHALAEGATHLAISDGPTLAMTEGHDRSAIHFVTEKMAQDFVDVRNKANNNKKWKVFKANDDWVASEHIGGDLAAQDDRLPAIMKKLVEGREERVDFGYNKDAYGLENDAFGQPRTQAEREANSFGSKVFKNPDGTGKNKITARLWDITKPRESIRRLFSLYDADAQTSFEDQLSAAREQIDSGQRPSEELSREQVLQRAVDGNLSKLDPLLNFLNAVRGEKGVIRAESFENPDIMAMVNLDDRTISINKDVQLKVNEAFSKLAHEQTHIAIDELPQEVQKALKQNVLDLGPQRRSILENLKKELKMGDTFDPEYLAGELFDPADPHYADKVMHEFTGGLMEAAAQSHFQQQPTGWMKYLPAPVVRLLKQVMQRMRSYFGEDFPSMSAMLNRHEASRLNSIVDEMQKSAVDAEQINLRSLLKLHETSKFDESNFLPALATREDFAPKSGPSELASFASDLYNPVKKAIKEKYENHLLSGWFRGRIKPETLGHMMALHQFRPSNISDGHGYQAFLGQSVDGKLSQQQAIERWGNFFDSTIANTGQVGENFRSAVAKIMEENNIRREASPVKLTEAELVQPSEMISKFKLTEEQAEYAKRLVKVSDLVEKEAQRKAEHVDATDATRMFYGANKDQDIEGVRQKIFRITRITKDAGHRRFELEFERKRLEHLQKLDEPNLDEEASAQQNIATLEAQDQQFKVLMDHIIRQEFAGAIPFKLDGPDPFINRMSEFMINLSSLRAKQAEITASAGWSSMTRRGRYKARVTEANILGTEFGKTKEFVGFHDEAAREKYLKEAGYSEEQIERYDTNELKDRMKMFNPKQLDIIRKEVVAKIDSAIDEFKGLNDMTPEQASTMEQVLSDVKARLSAPMEEDLKAVISVKGNKFGQRRYNIAGFNTNDFLPNTFEHMEYKTVVGNKAIAKAESDLQISRKELDGQPELRERMMKEQSYALNSQTEYNLAKKLIFYFYLGANPRHMIQNAVQIPLNGVSQMVAEGHGLSDSYKHFGKAASLVTRYNYKGTTGDTTIDTFLKQAEKDGVSFSVALEGPDASGTHVQNVLDSLNASIDGKIGYGTKLSLVGTKIARGFEKFLQATSVAAESANRRTSFVASILAERSKGLSDPRALYDKASQFTNFVNFVGDKPNRPGYMILHGNAPVHGAFGLLSALQTFTINHISQLYSFYQKGFNQGSAADKKAFATGLAHLLVFAGGMGVVGMTTAEQLVEEITGKSFRTLYREGLINSLTSMSDDEDTKNTLAHTADRIADTTMFGFPALLGIDSSGSIGLGSPFFRYQAGQPLTVEQFGGAGVGMLGRVAQAVGTVSADPFNPQAWWSATRSASPGFLSNAIKTYDLLNSGASLDSKQQPVGEPLDVGGSASALMGFTPMETSKQRAFNNRDYKNKKKAAEDYERNVLNVAQLLHDYETTGSSVSQERANKIFDAYIDSVSGLQDRGDMINSITDQLQQFRGQKTPAASLKGSKERQVIEKAFPSLKHQSSSAVDAVLDEISVAESLGQDDILVQKLMSLPESLRRKVLQDALTQVGVRPEEAGQFLQPRSTTRLGH